MDCVAARMMCIGGIVLRKISIVKSRRGVRLGGANNDFIQFAAIEPHTPAFEAKVNFDAEAFGGLQRFFTKRTKHGGYFFEVKT